MKKVKINGCLKSIDENYLIETVGQIDGKNIFYKDNNVDVKINIVDNFMIRSSVDYEIMFNFDKNKKTSSDISLKDLDKTMHMCVETLEIVNKENYYYVKYKLNDEELFEFELSYQIL